MTIEKQLSTLQRMSPAQLREKYADVFGEPSRSGNKDFLLKRVAWRIQSLAEGGLSERAKRRADELARDADVRTTIPRLLKSTSTVVPRTGTIAPTDLRLPLPGTVLTRTYRGKQVRVTVLSDSQFEFEGERYRSLTAVAKAVTGSHWNGYLFFGLTQAQQEHR